MENLIFIMNGRYYCVILEHNEWDSERGILCLFDEKFGEFVLEEYELEDLIASSRFKKLLYMYIIPSNIIPLDIVSELMEHKRRYDLARYQAESEDDY